MTLGNGNKNTLGLNMIVGANEARELRRCLDSLHAKEGVFDEIVLVLTSGDKEVEAVAREYTDKVIHHEWASERYPHGNFAAARNAALDATTTDYVWWQDADDVFKCKTNEDSFSKTIELVKGCDKKIDAFFIEYSLIVTDALQPVVSFLKERIFRRKRGMRWRYPVHELLRDRWDGTVHAVIQNIHTVHMAEKTQYTSASRNVRILEHEYNQGDKSLHTTYFLARDMMMVGRYGEAIKMFMEIVDNLQATPENLHSICTEMMFYYSYGKVMVLPKSDDMEMENEKNIEKWVRLDIAFADKYAEPYILLGDLYYRRNKNQDAERMYLTALKKQYGIGMMQIQPFYRLLPMQRLADVNVNCGLYEKALALNKQAIVNCPSQSNGMYDNLLSQRRQLLEILSKELLDGNGNADTQAAA